MQNSYMVAYADNLRFVMSKRLHDPTAATHKMITFPRFSFVTDVWLWVEEAGSDTGVTVGWSGNGETAQAAGFMSASLCDVGNTGLKRATSDNLQGTDGKYFNAAGGCLTCTVAVTHTTGKYWLFANYIIIH